jgi:sec-independent protein translocase protein TatA
MMGISLTNIIIVLFIVLILFGAGKLPKVMGDLGKGIKNLKDSLKEEEKDTKDNSISLNEKKIEKNEDK